MKKEVTNEEILEAVHTGFMRVDQQFARVDEQINELALMTKVQFDDLDRKISILSHSRGLRFWP